MDLDQAEGICVLAWVIVLTFLGTHLSLTVTPLTLQVLTLQANQKLLSFFTFSCHLNLVNLSVS